MFYNMYSDRKVIGEFMDNEKLKSTWLCNFDNTTGIADAKRILAAPVSGDRTDQSDIRKTGKSLRKTLGKYFPATFLTKDERFVMEVTRIAKSSYGKRNKIFDLFFRDRFLTKPDMWANVP